MDSNKIIDVLDPVNPQDVATKAYVDSKQSNNNDPYIVELNTGSNTTK